MLNMFIPEPLIGIEFMHLGPMSRCLEDAVLLSHIWNLSDTQYIHKGEKLQERVTGKVCFSHQGHLGKMGDGKSC